MELAQIPDEVFAYCDLKEDLSFACIPPQARKSYIETALQAGRQAAEKYAGQSLLSVLQHNGVTVRRFEDAPGGDLHAQICYDDKMRQIDLFLPMTRKLSEAMAKTPYPVTAEQVEEMFLAHEFYHYLEYAQGQGTEALCPPVKKKMLGLFSVQSRVIRMREIAAFVFSKQICRAAVHPKAMDYALLCDRRGQPYSELCAWVGRLQAEYEAACTPQKGDVL